MQMSISLLFGTILALASGHSLSASAGAYRATVDFRSVTFSTSNEQASYWGGGGSTPPEMLVTGIRIACKGQTIRIPRSAYADLANVNRVLIILKKGGCILRLEGGDASVAYDADLVVRGSNLMQRWVRDGEFPENFWEKTTYYSKPPEN